MDFRLRADGELFVLEANANPNISAAEDFAQSALKAGMSYDDLLHRILQLGENYPAAWRAMEALGRSLQARPAVQPAPASTVSYH
jgi:D-alanine-D-alanine ligase